MCRPLFFFSNINILCIRSLEDYPFETTPQQSNGMCWEVFAVSMGESLFGGGRSHVALFSKDMVVPQRLRHRKGSCQGNPNSLLKPPLPLMAVTKLHFLSGIRQTTPCCFLIAHATVPLTCQTQTSFPSAKRRWPRCAPSSRWPRVSHALTHKKLRPRRRLNGFARDFEL